MRAIRFAKRLIRTIQIDEQDDLRRSTVFSLAAMILVCVWLMTWNALHTRNLEALWPTLILLAGALGSIRLRDTHLQAAQYVLVFAVIGTVACQKWLFPLGQAQFFFPIVVVIASMLLSGSRGLMVGLLASVVCGTIARIQGADWLNGEEMLTPNILIQLTAFTSWLSARQVMMALTWMQKSYSRTRDLLEQLRQERSSMTRTLMILEEAYSRIEKMNSALFEARRAAEAARQIKMEFAANVSHELRTPLNIIIGFSETMANAPETYDGVLWSPDLRGDVEQIYQSSRHLASLIDDILDLSAMEVHRLGLTLVETDIYSVIAEATSVVQDLFKAKNLFLKVQTAPGLPILRMDSTRIRQVLINLLTNASRFTTEGGITVTAKVVGREVRVAVADTGIGIAPENVSKVFEEFSQVDGSASRPFEGSGLGVPISKRLIELHDGQMWLESKFGYGTTFYFTLPIASEIRHTEPADSDSNQPITTTYRKEILVAESDPFLLRTMRRQLSGYEVVEVRNPTDLPTLIAYHQPVAIVLDKATDPGLFSGFQQPELIPTDLPVISVCLPSTSQSAQTMGVTKFLIKPILREQLLAVIRSLSGPIHFVLIGGDEPQSVELLCRMLQTVDEGYRLLKALGNEEMLARLRTNHVDLMILDLQMPDINRLEVLQTMKNEPRLSDIPVLVVSAQSPEWIKPEVGLEIILSRPTATTITESLNCVEGLLASLPRRGLPDLKPVPALPATPSD